jgi:hypothetical protein
MSYIGFTGDRYHLAHYKGDSKHKFSHNRKIIKISLMLGLLIFLLPTNETINIQNIPKAPSQITRNVERIPEQELILELKANDTVISELILRILLIWTMSNGSTPTTIGFQPKPVNSPLTRLPGVKIPPKLQKHAANKNNLGQGLNRNSSIESMANNLSPKYQEFQNKYDLHLLPRFQTNECSIEKFKNLARDPRSNIPMYNRVSIDEARTAVQAELQNIIIEPSRPNKLEARLVDLDYKVRGPGLLTHVDIKQPVGTKTLKKQNQTITVEEMAYKIGQNIFDQKQKFIGLKNGPVTSQNVGHIVDLCYVPKNEKAIVKKNVLSGAKDQGSDSGIIFVNDK